jgi:branched-chain amino acid transport system permease protein
MIGTFASVFTFHAIGIDRSDPTIGALALVGTFAVVGVAAMLASGAAAVIMERVAYRPLRRRNAPRLAALITAIGISVFLQELFAVRYGRNQLPAPRVFERDDLFSIGGVGIRNDRLLVFVAAIVLMVLLDRFVNGSRLGMGIRATAQDAETAQLMGVNIDRVVMLTFLLGGLLAGAAGFLYGGIYFETARYNLGFLPGIKAFTAAVLGGIGNIRGALLGGLLLGLLENWGASVLGGEWKDVFAFAVLIAVLMFRPTGLLGESLARARA